MINDPKPYGVGAGRLWLESHMSKIDPKIGDPYATQVVKEIDAYVERAILQARSQAYEECAKLIEEDMYTDQDIEDDATEFRAAYNRALKRQAVRIRSKANQ